MFVQGILQCICLKPEKVFSDHMDFFFFFKICDLAKFERILI